MEAFDNPGIGTSVFVLDTKTGEVYYHYKTEWVTWGTPKDNSKSPEEL